MNLSKFSKLWLMALLPLVGLTACHDDDDPTPPNPADMTSTSIVGEWLENASDEHRIGMTETHYGEDGSLAVHFVLVSNEINEVINYDGHWSVQDEEVSETYSSPFTGATVTDKFHLLYTDKYSIVVYMPTTTEMSQMDRIVDSYTLSIGESREFSIEDPEFVAETYKSTNNHVATVDASGHIVAKNPGIAYITASSRLGNAVNKVTVTSHLIIDDYVQYIGQTIQEVTEEFGSIYATVPDGTLTYRIFQTPNPIVNQVDMGYAMQVVRHIIAGVRPGSDMQAIMDAWDKMYTNVAHSKTIRQYIIERNGARYFMMIDSNTYTIQVLPYTEPTPPPTPDFNEADFTQFKWLPGTPIKEAAKKLNYTLTEENMEDGFLDIITLSDNAAFEHLSVLFDESEEPYEVYTIFMRTKSGVTEDNLKTWLGSIFTATGEELNPFTYEGENGTVYVYYKTSGARFNVYYSTIKRRR